jgi:hypothetical protein
MPREAQGGPQQGEGATQSAGAPGNTPGGGIGEPINTPDPLTKYKWWILGGLGLLLAATAAFLLRKPAGGTTPAYAAAPGLAASGFTAPGLAASGPTAHAAPHPATVPTPAFASPATPAAKNAALLNALKEELFALESEKLSGTLTPEEYAEVKPALEVVLKRALKRNS